MPLSDSRRAQLDDIVLQLAKQNAPKGDVQLIVNDFLSKYGNESPAIQQQPQREISTLGNIANAAKNVAIGGLKGAGSTVLGIGELGTKTLGRLVGADVKGTSEFAQQQRETTLKPQGTAQKIGFGAEQIGEFFVPGGAVTKAGKAIEGARALSNLPKFGKASLSLLGKAGLESASMAGITASQKGSGEGTGTAALLGAGGALAGSTLSAIGKAASPLLKTSAEKSLSRVLGPTTKANKAITAKIVPGLLERGTAALSRKGLLSKFSESVKNAGETMDSVLEGIPPNSPVNLNAVASKLEEAKNAFLVPNAEGKLIAADPQAVAHIEGFQKIISQIGGENAPFASVRQLRQIWDTGVAKAGGFHGKTLTEGSLIEAQRTAANALRSELVKGRPDLAKINAEFNFWSNAQDVLKQTIERTTSQGTPLTKQAFRVAGIAKGGLTGLGLSALGEIVGSTAWRTVSAATKNKLAQSLAKGNMGDVIMTATKILGGSILK